MLSVTAEDLWVVAQTAYGEARGEGAEGMAAVVHTIANRATLHRRWQGLSLTAICQAPWQYSAWNAHDPNRPRLLQVTLADPAFADALTAAVTVLSGQQADPTAGATHYYADTLRTPPAWAQGHTPTLHLGHHLFFAHIP